MERAHARPRRKVAERRRLLRCRDPFARPLDRLDLWIGRAKLVGPAALAGAVPRPLRRLGGRIERDVLALGRPRRAARPAIDAGRADGEEEACRRMRGRGGRRPPTAPPRRWPAALAALERLASIMGDRHRDCSGVLLASPALRRSAGGRTPDLAFKFFPPLTVRRLADRPRRGSVRSDQNEIRPTVRLQVGIRRSDGFVLDLAGLGDAARSVQRSPGQRGRHARRSRE